MRSALQVSVVEDRNAPDDGYAIVRLIGVGDPPDSPLAITLERMSSGPSFLSASGWQSRPVSLAVDTMTHRGNVLDLLIGPPVTDHLEAGARVRLSVEALGFADELTWPTLTRAAQERAEAPAKPAEPLAAPTDRRARGQAGLRAAPRATGEGARREPRLGRPERPTQLAAARPAGERSRRGPAKRTDRARHSRRPDAPPSDGAAAAPMPWEWSDQPSAADADPPMAARADSAGDERPAAPERSRARTRAVPLPWRIVGINLVVLIVLGAAGYAMVFNGWDPIRMLTGSPADQASADRDGPSIQALPRESAPDAAAAMRQRALDALAVAITGPVGEARTAIEEGAPAAQLYALGRTFQVEGDPGTALPLFEYAALQGSGAAELAIGRMADPVYFEAEPTAFTRPNAELAVDRYRRALALGEAAAADDLDALQGWLQRAAAAGDQEARNALLLFESTEL